VRRYLPLVGFLAVLSASPFVSSLKAQDAQPQQDAAYNSGDDDITKWKLINTGIFVLVLGFGIIKLAPRFFNARSLEIQKAIKDATGLKIEADFRYSEIDKRMANLGAEVARLRAQNKAEMEREHQRLLKDTADEMEHIKDHIAAELDGMQKDGVRQVRLHTANLAIGLAERRLQTYFAEGKIIDNIHDFVNLVEQVKN
jgi:F0F1-type ATP synthase membrane subunit b/b'